MYTVSNRLFTFKRKLASVSNKEKRTVVPKSTKLYEGSCKAPSLSALKKSELLML